MTINFSALRPVVDVSLNHREVRTTEGILCACGDRFLNWADHDLHQRMIIAQYAMTAQRDIMLDSVEDFCRANGHAADYAVCLRCLDLQSFLRNSA